MPRKDRKVCLSLSVLADDGDTFRRKVQLLRGQVPKMPKLEVAQVHGGRPGRIPISMEEFSLLSPFWLPPDSGGKP